MPHQPVSGLAAIAAVLATSLLAACGGSSNEEPSAIDSRSTLAFGPCAVEIADASAVCGTLTVAEDRADTASRLIGLPFAILPATALRPGGNTARLSRSRASV
ncbi:MAG: hypothetical protein HC793_00810, partial [Aquincola sp.]|nr:hypothetical protein [Aquincola sp.]